MQNFLKYLSTAIYFILLVVVTTHAVDCDSETDPEKLSYLSPVVVIAQTPKKNHFDPDTGMYTAKVKKTFQTKKSGLKKNADISVLESPCPFTLDKNTQYILYLNSTDEKKTFTIAYAPYPKPSKKLLKNIHKKILCKKCTVVAPSFKRNKATMTATEGERYQISCKAGGKPKPYMTWLFNGEPLNAKKLKVKVSKAKPGKSTLTISKVQASKHQGTYICLAENAAPDSASYLVSLTVVPPPTTTPLTCTRCDSSYCYSQGECCIDANDVKIKRCVCNKDFRGERCDERLTDPTIDNRSNTDDLVTASESVIAILGLCVALLLSLIVCAAAYLFCLKPKNCKCHRSLEKPGIEGSIYRPSYPTTQKLADDQHRSLLSRNSTSTEHSQQQPQPRLSANNSQSNNNNPADDASLKSEHSGSVVSIEMRNMRHSQQLPSRSSVTSNSGRARLNGVAKEVPATQYRPGGYTSEGNMEEGKSGDQFSNPTYYPSTDIPFASSVSHPASLAAHQNVVSSPPMYSSYNANAAKYPDTSFHISENTVAGGSSDLGSRHPSYPVGGSSSSLLSSSKQLSPSGSKVSEGVVTKPLDVLKSDGEGDAFMDSLEDVKIPNMDLNISPSVSRHNPPRTYMGDSEGLFFPSPTPAAQVASAQRTHLPLLSTQTKFQRQEEEELPLSSASSSGEDLTEGRSIEI